MFGPWPGRWPCWAFSSFQPPLKPTSDGSPEPSTTRPEGAIPGAKTTIRDVDTQATRTVLTDANGLYVAQNLPIGPYSVTVEAPGFKSATRSGLQLVADGRITADFKLELGQSTQTVDVVAASADQLNTVSGEVAHVIDKKQSTTSR